ncbi:subtilisin-like serine protease [Tulasnella sp. 403]|nr:subtilisin-like serine protease [Tulasnella sp. 403]
MLAFTTFVLGGAFFFDVAFGAAVTTPSYVTRHRSRSGMPGLGLVNGDVKAGSYIVGIASTANRTQHLAWATSLVQNCTNSTDSITAWNPSFMNAYAASLDDNALSKVLANKDVAWVEEDAIMHTRGDQLNATWGLQRISSETPLPPGSNPDDLNFDYKFDDAAGSGVDVYVVDTGIRTTHEEFGGRAEMAFVAPGLNATDDNGHGSHVSGTVGGATFGVAKKVSIFGVKVLDADGGGATSDIISGIGFAVRSARQTGRPSVISMSLGGSPSRALDRAATAAVAAGMHVVVAAGNDAVDASTESPARAPGVITVGAMNIQDEISSFSNFGPAVDVFAPGEEVISVGIKSDTDTNILSGTSMATPHISGVVALLLSQQPTLTPTQMGALIQQLAIPGTLSGVPRNTTNLLAQNGLPSSTTSDPALLHAMGSDASLNRPHFTTTIVMLFVSFVALNIQVALYS